MKNIRQKTMDMLVRMASHPGSKAHAWYMAQELDKDDSGLFTGIAKELEAHMRRLSDGQQQNGG